MAEVVNEQSPVHGWSRASDHSRVGRVRPVGSGDASSAVSAATETLMRYGWAHDEQNPELLSDCFLSDGVWEGVITGTEQVGPFAGRKAIVDFLGSFWEVWTDQRRHVFTNVVAGDITTDTVTLHAYILLTLAENGTVDLVTVGPYRVDLARDDDGAWRIRHMLAGFDAPF